MKSTPYLTSIFHLNHKRGIMMPDMALTRSPLAKRRIITLKSSSSMVTKVGTVLLKVVRKTVLEVAPLITNIKLVKYH